jgi:hypothetical protein
MGRGSKEPRPFWCAPDVRYGCVKGGGFTGKWTGFLKKMTGRDRAGARRGRERGRDEARFVRVSGGQRLSGARHRTGHGARWRARGCHVLDHGSQRQLAQPRVRTDSRRHPHGGGGSREARGPASGDLQRGADLQPHDHRHERRPDRHDLRLSVPRPVPGLRSRTTRPITRPASPERSTCARADSNSPSSRPARATPR